MKLFDIIGGNVTIHEEALAIPAFKKIWEKDKADKQHAIAVISYIVFKNKWDSPYVLSMPADTLESALKTEFLAPDYQLTADEIIAEESYKHLQYTRTLAMLDSIRLKLDTFTKYYKDSLDEELDEKKIEKYLAGFGKVKDAYVTIDFLEKAVKAGEINTTKVKGDAQINPFELPQNVRK